MTVLEEPLRSELQTEEVLAAKARFQRVNRFQAVLMAGICTAIIVVGGAVFAALALDKQHDLQTATRRVEQLQARQDCARAINDERNQTLDERDNAKARLDQAYVSGQIAVSEDPSRLPEVKANLVALAADLDAKIKAVNALEPVGTQVERRCPD